MSFQTRYGHYEFLVMSFCLTNTLTTFMDLMNRVFLNYLDSFVIVFIDDILVYSKNEGEHMDHLGVLLQVLKKHQLFTKYGKCKFWLRFVEFPCQIISSEGKDINKKKTVVVKNWSRSLIPNEIRSFLALIGYYRRFVNRFASITSPMTTLTQMTVKFEW